MNAEPTVSDVLRKAAEILAEKGHCKGRLHDKEGRVCLYGALDEAGKSLGLLKGEVRYRAFDAADAAVEPLIGTRYAPDWNDAPERTGTEVEKFLIGLADKAEFGE